jgi:hypothetical protein
MALAPIRSSNAMSDMAAIMDKARAYSDSRLADVLAGKDVSIPQYVAMTEAMGRKQLRQAVDGAQAQQQSQQPSVKDRLLAEQQAEMGGIAALPAPNMESVDMASGGIIAFDQGGDVPRYNGSEEEEQLIRDRQQIGLLDRIGAGILDVASLPVRAGAGVINPFIRDARRLTGANIPYVGDIANIDPNVKAQAGKDSLQSMTPFYDTYIRRKEEALKNKPKEDRAFALFDAATEDFEKEREAKKNAKNVVPTGGEGQGTGKDSGKGAAVEPPKGRENPFIGLTTDQVDFNKLKSQGMGEGLMKAAAGLLSKPTFAAGLGAGISALADSGMATRKEIAGLRKDAQDYNLLRLRAAEAFEQGREDLAFKYSKMAQDKEIGLAQISKMGQSGDLNLLKALQRPGEDINDTFARMQSGKYAPKSDAQLEQAWSKSSVLRLQHDNDFEKYKAAMRGGAGGGSSGKFTYLGTE